MTTFAFPLPDKLVAQLTQLASLPPERLETMSNEVAEFIEEILEEEEGYEILDDYPGKFPRALTQEDLKHMDPEDIAAIQRGLEDCEAGRVIDGDTFFAEMFARVGLPYPPEQKPA